MGMMLRRNIKRRAVKKTVLPKEVEQVRETSFVDIDDVPKKRGRKPSND